MGVGSNLTWGVEVLVSGSCRGCQKDSNLTWYLGRVIEGLVSGSCRGDAYLEMVPSKADGRTTPTLRGSAALSEGGKTTAALRGGGPGLSASPLKATITTVGRLMIIEQLQVLWRPDFRSV